MIKVYLSGSIDFADLGFASCWRQQAIEALSKSDITCHDPLAGKDITDPAISTKYSPSLIVRRDLLEISSSDILLVEMTRNDIPYVGTSMEMFAAAQVGIPIVVWHEYARLGYWATYFADYAHRDLDSAIVRVQLIAEMIAFKKHQQHKTDTANLLLRGSIPLCGESSLKE